MKPKHIILVRHGESEGNVNRQIYSQKPDYALELTTKGKKQAEDAGRAISFYLRGQGIAASKAVQFYVSPFWRTRQTYKQIAKSFPNHVYYEDPRLREQEWSTNLTESNKNPDIENERDSYGHFYFRFPNGESCADVYDRKSCFMGTMFRDFQKVDFPLTSIIVGHGTGLRVLLMRFFHWSVEEFELLANPHNCQFFILKLNKKDKYDLITPMPKYPNHDHPYQFDWNKI